MQQSFLEWISTTPAIAGAVVTALIGGFVALVVATVNAASAHALERSRTRRSYRSEILAAALAYVRATARIVHAAKQSLDEASPLDSPIDSERLLRDLEAERMRAAAMYVPDGTVRDSLELFTAIRGDLVYALDRPPVLWGADLQKQLNAWEAARTAASMRSAAQVLLSAAELVELAAEVYVYGGILPRLKFWRRRRYIKKRRTKRS